MNAMTKAVVLSACLIALAACGSDDKDETPAAGTGGAGGESGSSGASGAGEGGTSGGGSGGTGGTGGTGGMMAEPVVCGGETCGAPSSATRRACCIEATQTCGENFAGFGECAEPVESHPECESAMIRSFMVPSCCTPEGRCGLSAPMFGFDCMSNEDTLALGPDGGVADGGTADGGMNPFGEAVPMPSACTPFED
jgi:hypothetical protein